MRLASPFNGGSPRAPNDAVRRLRRCVVTCTMLPMVYAAFGLMALAAPQYEVFPFFSWFLFPVTPTTVTRWAVRVEQLDGRELPTPTWYEQELSLGAARHSIDAQVLIQALGYAQQHNDAATVGATRTTFESSFLISPCKYSLFERTYDPLERWVELDDGKTNSAAASFECAKP